ncbi:hypothetical protein MMC30_004300 [Trapelia coarctata]|nr:hypothetical protein [Trapelia coarctata]
MPRSSCSTKPGTGKLSSSYSTTTTTPPSTTPSSTPTPTAPSPPPSPQPSAPSPSPSKMPWPTPIPLSSPSGDPLPGSGGVAVLQVSPLAPETHLFLHTSILRFSLRALMCDASCIESPPPKRPTEHQRIIGNEVRTMGAVVTKSDNLYGHLVGKRRLLA